MQCSAMLIHNLLKERQRSAHSVCLIEDEDEGTQKYKGQVESDHWYAGYSTMALCSQLSSAAACLPIGTAYTAACQ